MLVGNFSVLVSGIGVPNDGWLIGTGDVAVEKHEVSIATSDSVIAEEAIKSSLVGVSRGSESLSSIVTCVLLARLNKAVRDTEIFFAKDNCHTLLESMEVQVAEAGESLRRDVKIVVLIELGSEEPTSWIACEITDGSIAVDVIESVGTDAAVARI